MHDIENDFTLLGSFEEGPYKITAYQPNLDHRERVIVLRATEGDRQVAEREVPMSRNSVYGVNVDDAIAMQAESEDLVKELFDGPTD